MADLANCPRCGNLFVKQNQDVCADCFKKEEEDFQTVYEFMRKKKNRMSTMNEVAETTGVDKHLIQKWLIQRRIHPGEFPNLTYDCERCGTQIYEGRLCLNCAGDLQNDLKEEAGAKTIAEQEQEKRDAKVYYNVQQENKWRD
ncbi:TIGR03826 family flagellar region protein [Alkalibacillus salilacus]|uniref:Flagellar operon protein (TIGR03826 family) n=1 Tax=Alkalibacillus salilacus TaxID=284582 RepID=A0ABT9VFE2_9BACI|nr:TIGR03826 family flagellar region protein [Alkalibacillus salilacus]MDQ0159661.1 flagellar operon protein (TIGR03826 family) [Alkalibacillus salilacus]